MGQSLCSQCAALCCRYFALPIDNPTTQGEYDDVRWYLCHENVTVFIEKGQWYIGLANRCKHLQADNRCGIYHTRPRVCRKYDTENCDYHGGEYEFERLFTSAEQLAEYAREKLAERRRKKASKARTAAKVKRSGPAKRNRQAPRSWPLAANGNGNNGTLLRKRSTRSIALPLLRSTLVNPGGGHG